MDSIVRRPDRVEGGITHEEKAKLADHARLWINRALRTDPIEPEQITKAIHDLYAAASLKRPRVVIVPSPLVMALAGGFASAIWHTRKNGQTTSAATDAATYAATDAATRAATSAATGDATYAATDAATRAATSAATYAATDAATYAATRAATSAATSAATDAATDDDYSWVYRLAAEIGGQPLAPLMIACTRSWWQPYQGGNMWAAWPCYLSAFRDVLGLRLPEHDKFSAWERAAIHGGFRWMHDEFCMISDFPEVLLTDAEGRPHCDHGPSHRWRDGWALYHIHGVRVDAWVIEHPERITADDIAQEQNAEIRRVMIERYGLDRYLLDSGADPVARDECGILYRRELDDDEPIVMVRVLNSTPEPDGVLTRSEAISIFGDVAAAVNAPDSARFKEYMIRVDPECRPLLADGTKGDPQELTARNAVASTFGLRGEDYEPQFES